MKDNPSRTSWLSYLPHAVIIIVGVSFSLFLFFVIHLKEETSLRREFRRIARNRVQALERSIENKISVLESVRCFFESSEYVERGEFATFTDSFSESNDIYIIAWAPKVDDKERTKFETNIQNQIPGFYIKEQDAQNVFIPAQKRSEYFPIYYLGPYTKQNAASLGYDIASEKRRYEALSRACDDNIAVATEKLHLVHDVDGTNSFMIFLPVYLNNTPIGTVRQRRENLEGFVIGAFNIQKLVEHAMSFTDLEHIRIYISDLSADQDKRFLYYYTSENPVSNGHSPRASILTTPLGLYLADVIDVGTRQWAMICTPEPALIDLYMNGNTWDVLTIGLLLTFLTFLYFLFSWRKTEAIHRLVAVRTEELSRELNQRTKTEKKLAKTAEQLESKNNELERVIYIASHDLRSPLITISGFDTELQRSCQKLNSLLEEITTDEQKKAEVRTLLAETIPESLSFITAGVEKAQMLIDGLLQVSRIGTSPFKIEHINMNKLMADVVGIQRFQAKQRNADVIVEELPDCMGDVAKTNQVFSNLIDNALKYLTPNRQGKITITGIRDGEYCIYCVEDNGQGIEPEHQARIFQMFNRACADTSIKGEGLGLAIVVRILEGQDGKVRLESEPGKGSKFYVSMPSA